MKKLLLIFSLLFATMLGIHAQSSCSYIFTMHDEYGDGWNYAQIIVKQGTTPVDTFTLGYNISDLTDSMIATPGQVYSLYWEEGSYDNECSFSVTFNGITIYSCANAENIGDSPFCTFIGCLNCFPPEPHVVSSGQYNADIAWNSDGQTQWEYTYGDMGFNPDSSVVFPLSTTDTFVSISSLNAGTNYDFYIRSVCDPSTNEVSAWKRLLFATAQEYPATVPYTNGFETTDDTSWVLVNGNNTNKWVIGSAVHNTGSRALYISDNNGVSFSYDYYNESSVWAYRDIDLGTAGNAHNLSFDWNCEGYFYAYYDLEEYYDYMDVYIGAPNFPSGNNAPTGATLLGRYAGQNSWQQENILLSESYSGIQRLYFHWTNTDYSYSMNAPAAVDNISIVEMSCGSIDSVTVDNVTTSSITLTPHTASSATDYVLYYKKASDTEYDTVEYVSANPSYSLDNLSSGTYYNIIMRIDCGNGDLGFASNEISIMTNCDMITAESLPYVDGFETYNDTEFPNCWNRLTTYPAYSYDYPYVYDGESSAGHKSMYFYTYSTYYNTAILPEIDANVNINTLVLSFMIKTGSSYSTSTYNAIVGVMDSINDMTSFVPVDTVSALSSGAWSSVDVSFANYTGTGKHIAIYNLAYDTSASYNCFYIDDVTLYVASDCQRPSSVTASNILSDSVTITWTPQGTETAWMVAVVPAGGNPDAVTAIACTEDSVVIGDLVGNTEYEAYVKADCGSETSIWTAACSFLTACSPYSVPFLEDFNSGDIPPSQCWEKQQGRLDSVSNLTPSTYGWGSKTSEIILGEGAHTYINIYGSSRSYWLISPTIDLGDGTVPAQVEMDVLLTDYSTMGAPDINGTDDKFAIVISTDNGQTWSSRNAYIWDNDTTSNSYGTYNNLATLTHLEIPLRDAAGQAYTGQVKIALYGESTISNADNDLHIDNFAVNPLSSCPRPTNLTASNLGTDQITISWDGSSDANEWNVAIFPNDTDYTSDMLISNITDTFYTFTNLSANTAYTIYVQANCGTEVSSFAHANSQTLCNSIDSLPYFEGFENYASGENSYPDCWFKFNSSGGTTPFIYNYSAITGSRSLYFYAYSGYILATMPKFDESLYPLNTLQVTFNLKSEYTTSKFVVGYTTNPLDPTAFVGLDTLSCAVADLAEAFEVPFTATTVTNGQIAFKVITNTSSYDYAYFYLDDVTVDLAPNCPRPTNLHVALSSANSIDLAWTPMGNEDEWEVVYDSTDFNPDNAIPIPVYTTPTTSIGNLSNNNTYWFYVRAICVGNENSEWRGPITAMPGTYSMPTSGTNTISLCGGHIYDDGGANGDYSSSCNSTLIIMPDDTNMLVQLQGTYEVESGWDQLSIYDGSGTSGTLLFETSTSTSGTVPLVESTTGPLTIYFESDGSVCYDGFDLTVNCIPAPTCRKPMDVTVSNTTATDVTLSWTEMGSATTWEIEYGNHGFTLGTGTLVSTTSNPYTISSLTTGTAYDFYVRSNCGSGDESDWAGPIAATPGTYNMPTSGEYTVSMCGGVIYDDGGVDGNYSPYCDVTLVVNPETPGMMVHLTGTFNLEEGYDYLEIYDGNTTDGTMLFDSETDATLDVTSTTGPLTIYFYSDGSAQYSGFALTVSCENGQTPQDSCDAPTNLTYSELTHNSVKLDWAQEGTPDSWTINYKKTSADTWSTVNAFAHPYTITNLEAETEYEAYVTATCGTELSGESNHITFTTETNGINGYDVNNITLYPNPTTGLFTIENIGSKIQNVEVYDVYGKLINSIKVDDNTVSIDASSFASGVYFTRITTEQGTTTVRVVKN